MCIGIIITNLKLENLQDKMILLLYISLLLVTTTPSTGTQVTSTLELLYENGNQVTSKHQVQKRVSIVYQVESDTVIAENFAKVKSVQKLWSELKVFSTESSLKNDLFSLLTVGSEYFSKAGSCLKHLVSFASDSDSVPGTNCNFTGRALNGNTMREDSNALVSMIGKIDDTWTLEAVLADVAKINFLYSLANMYNSIGYDWHDIASATVSEYDQLRKLSFPDSLHGHLETAACLEPVAFESIVVLSCGSNKKQLFCELEVSVPENKVVYGLFQVLNYYGAQLRGPTGKEIFVRNPDTQEVVLLLCNTDSITVHPEIPICKQIEEQKTCLTNLLRHEVDDAIKNCKFEYKLVDIVTRLETEEILVQGDDTVHVAEGAKVIFQPLPLIIGSSEKVTITVSGTEEYDYFGTGSKSQGVKISKLTKTQINMLLLKATWDDMIRDFNIHDYVEYLALGLQLLFAPLTIVGIVLACRARRVSEKSRKKIEKDTKRCNYKENRNLLKGRNSR